MIGKLSGCIMTLGEDNLILDVNDVGYLITLSQRVLSTLTLGSRVCFFIDTYIKDDKILLYGFQTSLEQDWFRLLQTTQGVGAKFALSLLSYFTPDRLYDMILQEARSELVLADGVGPKLASRLITELKDPLTKRPHLRGETPLPPLNLSQGAFPSSLPEPLASDLLSALTNLGYKKTEALYAIEKIKTPDGSPPSLEQTLKTCLTYLSRS